jgi:hypothetical protein
MEASKYEGEAQAHQEMTILPEGETVEVDSRAVDIVTQSCVQPLISESIRRYGEQSFALIEFRKCSARHRPAAVIESLIADPTAMFNTTFGGGAPPDTSGPSRPNAVGMPATSNTSGC